jgi:acyl transferase domain-containing protein
MYDQSIAKMGAEYSRTQARYDVPKPSAPTPGPVSGIKPAYTQDPIAVVGLANRLPGHSNNPTKLWEFLLRGGIAKNDPPESRFGLAGHYDGSHKPHTLKTPGAMFLEDHDPADFDPAFFKTTVADAISMDPQQRMLLEVVYEALENAGISLSQINGEAFGCFVGSYAVGKMSPQFDVCVHARLTYSQIIWTCKCAIQKIVQKASPSALVGRF